MQVFSIWDIAEKPAGKFRGKLAGKRRRLLDTSMVGFPFVLASSFLYTAREVYAASK